MKEIKRTTVTAALPYANGPLHIGHIAGAYLPADIYVRCLRARGKEVLFVCGSDEHGAAITIRALKDGTTPKAIVDKYHAMMGRAFQDFGIHFDIYHPDWTDEEVERLDEIDRCFDDTAVMAIFHEVRHRTKDLLNGKEWLVR